jgi:hypothetical protein
VLGNTDGRVQSDGIPYELQFVVGDAMAFQKVSGSIGTVDLKP